MGPYPCLEGAQDLVGKRPKEAVVLPFIDLRCFEGPEKGQIEEEPIGYRYWVLKNDQDVCQGEQE